MELTPDTVTGAENLWLEQLIAPMRTYYHSAEWT